MAMTVALAGCGDGETAAPTTTVVPTTAAPTTEAPTTTTVPPTTVTALEADPSLTPEEQVEAAYLRSWEVYLEALRSGQTIHLRSAYAGAALSLRLSEIQRLVDQGHAVEGTVDHNYEISFLDDATAVVIDRYTNGLTLVDGTTRQTLEPTPNDRVVRIYTLKRLEGRWLVSDVVRPQ